MEIYQHLPKIRITNDGSTTLYIEEYDEPYHSINGAIQESMHVFINEGLSKLSQQHIRIFEVGFGTGLNAFLSCKFSAENNKTIAYTGIEISPIPIHLISQLNFTHNIHNEQLIQAFNAIHQSEWETEQAITNNFTIKKNKGSINSYSFESTPFDIIYYDAFAPDKQPEMWNISIFEKLYMMLNQGGLLVTYCAKGSVRRALRDVGFNVSRLPGPPGKREMLRAEKV